MTANQGDGTGADDTRWPARRGGGRVRGREQRGWRVAGRFGEGDGMSRDDARGPGFGEGNGMSGDDTRWPCRVKGRGRAGMTLGGPAGRGGRCDDGS